MVNRLINPTKSNSFFILGPRGSGKSTWVKSIYLYPGHNNYYVNLLQPKSEDHYRRNPEMLKNEILDKNYDWVIIDEVQKLPQLLDIVQDLIEEKGQKFVLTGSSARKLKRGAANLLAGRAFVYYFSPFTAWELDDKFDLDFSLNWGLLPKLLHLTEDSDRLDFLESYCLTYLKEEIQQEQIVRKLEPFRHFLEVSAQMNGKVINFSKIAREVGVDTTTVQNYYSILEDTLIGFYLNAYHTSIRKRIIQAPKFYYFDVGVARSLSRILESRLIPQTSAYGFSFEHFVILEIWKLSHYFKKKWHFSYLLTKDDVEIDLIIDDAIAGVTCIEIKSTTRLVESDLDSFITISKDIKRSRSFCFSKDPQSKTFQHVKCLYWQEGIKQLFDKS